MRWNRLQLFFTYVVLTIWSVIVLFPIWTLLINSFKPQKQIFKDPFGLPDTFTLDGYREAWNTGRFDLYFINTIIVTVIALGLILFIGSMAAYALAKWKSPVASFLYVFFIAGLMIPIRLGTLDLVRLIKALNLQDTYWSLIPVYVAMGMPIATFVLTAFIKELPGEMFEAAKIDGASEWQVYSRIVLPLMRPAMATVAIFNMIKIWNDFWFPLVFIRAEESRTVALGVSLLFGQYRTDWTRALAVLSLAAVPMLILYVLLAREFIKGLTAGAVKG
ncbi:MAG: carbohydrate ABC transporter permease [Anaerolineales bacterium]|jgi:raffinose/stachyose/melibiose transport system permease protein|nr:carbohydrate ABC transporter permease [Chloroflexota bacterium]MBK6647172.1 carbohydrate ABC transporter permease [Anaerolineales bacterium]MCC6986650.1 carbohydrate ABC transporter permease [Anaerolineales bacterium]